MLQRKKVVGRFCWIWVCPWCWMGFGFLRKSWFDVDVEVQLATGNFGGDEMEMLVLLVTCDRTMVRL